MPYKLFISLKVPERDEKCLRVSSSVKGKSLFTLPSGRECHVARMEECRSAFKVLTGIPAGKRLLGSPRRR